MMMLGFVVVAALDDSPRTSNAKAASRQRQAAAATGNDTLRGRRDAINRT
jgi:hypothetical protein